MKPVTPAAPKTLDMKPATPSVPAVILTARILPPSNGQGRDSRRVMASIAEEGQAPRHFESGTLGGLGDLVAGLCKKYFPGNNGPEGEEEILMEVNHE